MTQVPKVELHVAFQWDCPDCGRENFCRAVTYEPSPEEAEELKRELAYHDSAQGHQEIESGGMWVTRPKEVMCRDCNHFFPVEESE